MICDLEIEAPIPAAVSELCACVIRVEVLITLFGISILAMADPLFLRFFPHSVRQPSATSAFVSSTGNAGSLQEASRSNRFRFLLLQHLGAWDST